ncbi:MAG: hypothetical protein HYX69_11215 [Planctomycetia bacterium]|nr:hypothetical protein [Planctomycetia bacterium]
MTRIRSHSWARSVIPFLLPLFISSIAIALARAENHEWIGDQDRILNPVNAWSFYDSTMWLGFAVPGFPANNDGDVTNDNAIFGGGYVAPNETAPFRLAQGATVYFGDFASTLAPGKGGPEFQDAQNVVNQSLSVQSGDWTFDFGGGGDLAHGSDLGSYTVSNIVAIGDRVLHTGAQGTASLTLTGGSTFTSGGGRIGADSAADGIGHITVGGGTTWLSTTPGREDISVHTGTLTVEGGATLQNDSGTLAIGRGAGNVASMVVKDSTTSLISGLKGDIVVGFEGGTGSLTVDAATTKNSNTMSVGELNNSVGQLNIVNGARASDRVGVVGNSGGVGQVQVSGAASLWQIGVLLSVHNGAVVLANGGGVTVGSIVALDANGSANVEAGHMNVGTGDLSSVPLGTLRLGPGGTLAGAGTVLGNVQVDGGAVSPGFSPGILHVTGDFLLGPSSSLKMEIGGLTPGLEHDQLDVAGNLSLHGMVNLVFVDGFAPHTGDTFKLFNVDGTFEDADAQYVASNLPPSWSFSTSFHDGGLYLTTVPEPATWTLAAIAAIGLASHARRRGHTARCRRPK